MQTFTSPSARCHLSYHDFPGHTPACLFVHGLGCAGSYEYPRVAADPAFAGRHAILPDLAGSGYSERPRDFSYTTTAHARTILELVDHLGLHDLYLYGHSMGGSIAIEAAAHLGNRLRGLIVSECNLTAGGGTYSRAIAAYREEDYIAHGHAALIAQETSPWAGSLRSSAPWAVWRSARSLIDGVEPDWLTRLSALPQRKTFLVGANTLPDADCERIRAAHIPTAIIPAAGHAMSWENPGGLAAALAAFMDEA